MKKTRKMRENKKAQFSLEFLVTYGWAFLAVLVAIGALAYFGILDPSRYTPKRCTFGSEAQCKDFKMVKNGGAGVIGSFKLTNIMGVSVDVTNANLIRRGGAAITGCSLGATGGSWGDSEDKDFVITCTGGADTLKVGEKTKLAVNLTYYANESGPNYKHVLNGELYDQLQ